MGAAGRWNGDYSLSATFRYDGLGLMFHCIICFFSTTGGLLCRTDQTQHWMDTEAARVKERAGQNTGGKCMF